MTFQITLHDATYLVRQPFRYTQGKGQDLWLEDDTRTLLAGGHSPPVMKLYEAAHFRRMLARNFHNELLTAFYYSAFSNAIYAAWHTLKVQCGSQVGFQAWQAAWWEALQASPIMKSILQDRNDSTHSGLETPEVRFGPALIFMRDGTMRSGMVATGMQVGGRWIVDPLKHIWKAFATLQDLIHDAHAKGFLLATTGQRSMEGGLAVVYEQTDGTWHELGETGTEPALVDYHPYVESLWKEQKVTDVESFDNLPPPTKPRSTQVFRMPWA